MAMFGTKIAYIVADIITMAETIEIPVLYKGEELIFFGELLNNTDMQLFQIEIEGTPILFEPDEKGRYRVGIGISNNYTPCELDIELLKVIVTTLESLNK